MKYCVSARQPPIVLNRADEISIEWRDRDILFDFAQKYPKTRLILTIPKDTEIDYKKLAFPNLTLRFEDIRQADKCALPFYWAYPITTYDELNALTSLGVSDVLISGPLFFDLKEVSKRKVPIRLVANLCYEGHIPHKNGICGQYIRPEDVPFYEKFAAVLEFRTDSIKKEATLFDVYANQKTWKGNLNILLTNLNCNVDNRAIPVEFAEARSQCRQDCLRNSNCHFCYTAMKFSRAVERSK
jgi:hypothetical protein